jgi:hypothetical protein
MVSDFPRIEEKMLVGRFCTANLYAKYFSGNPADNHVGNTATVVIVGLRHCTALISPSRPHTRVLHCRLVLQT